MATFKVSKIIKITSKVARDVAFKPYKQNFTYVLKGFEILELRTNEAEKSLYYYKAILPYADVEMIDDFDPTYYSISVTINNGTYTGPSKIDIGGTATITIEASSGYDLPSSVSVSGASFIYRVEGTQGFIDLSNPASDVEISATCVAQGYSITCTITNGSYSGDTTIVDGGTATIHILPSFGYAYPASDSSSIEVTNATIDSYSNGNLTISNPTGAVSIAYTCFAFNLSVSPVIDATTIGEKHAADLQESIEFTDRVEENERYESTASGTLLYISDYSTIFSGVYTSGHYMMINASAVDAATLTVGELYDESIPCESNDNGAYVIYLESTSNVISVKATIGNQVLEERIYCSNLTFQQAPTPPTEEVIPFSIEQELTSGTTKIHFNTNFANFQDLFSVASYTITNAWEGTDDDEQGGWNANLVAVTSIDPEDWEQYEHDDPEYSWVGTVVQVGHEHSDEPGDEYDRDFLYVTNLGNVWDSDNGWDSTKIDANGDVEFTLSQTQYVYGFVTTSIDFNGNFVGLVQEQA